MKTKRILSILLVIMISSSLIINDVKEVKASGVAVAGLVLTGLSVVVPCVIAAESNENYQNWYQNTYRPNYQDNIRQLFQLVGLPASSADIIGKIGGDPIQNVRLWLASKNNTSTENVTDNQCMEELYNMYSGCTVNANDDAFVFSGDLKNYTQYCVNKYIDNSGYKYGYSVDILKNTSLFANGDLYNAVKSVLENTEYDVVLFRDIQNVNSCKCVWFNNNIGLVLNSYDLLWYNVQPYDSSNWNYSAINSIEYNDNTKSFDRNYQSNITGFTNNFFLSKDYINGSYNLADYVSYSYNGSKIYKIYLSLTDFKNESVGVSPYYVTQYNGDFMSNNGNTTYTVDNSNYNPVTYGDIQEYVNSFNNNNNRYPTPTETQHYIDTYIPPDPTPLPDNPNSGNGSTVSGNGGSYASATATNGNVNVTVNNNPTITLGFPTLSGNTASGNTVSGNTIEGGVSDIFSFLSGIGKALGSLVKNLGTALTELLTSLVEVINDLVVKIPQTLNSFINIVFGALPEEIRSLIILGVTTMIVYGIIKMIRG